MDSVLLKTFRLSTFGLQDRYTGSDYLTGVRNRIDFVGDTAVMSRFICAGGFFACLALAVFLAASAHSVSAQVIGFETLVPSQTYGVDINNDGIDDVLFSTTDPAGFGNTGPDQNAQVYASGLFLESSSTTDPDIRVDFPGGAINDLQVGFALLTGVDDLGQGLLLEVFDQAGNQLGSTSKPGQILPLTVTAATGMSQFPEGLLSVSFDGVASYALVDATTTGGRFIIDNFSGTFLPAAIPEPSALALLGLGGVILLGQRRKTCRKP